jgi:hypothetical protein
MSKEVCDHYYTLLLGQTQTTLDGASEAEIQVQLFKVLDEFLDETNLWVEDIDFTVIPNVLDYALAPVSGMIRRLAGVVDQNNTPQQALLLMPETVHFLYPYSDTQPMTATMVKTVTDPLDCFPPEFPDWILRLYWRVLLAGVLGNMMAQPSSTYTDKAGAPYHLARFRDGWARARNEGRTMQTMGAQAWTYPQTYRTYSQYGAVSTFNVNPSAMTRR